MTSKFAQLVEQEVTRQGNLFPVGCHSLHEGYAVLLEEVDELWELVRMKSEQRDKQKVLEELVQIAAYAERISSSLKLIEDKEDRQVEERAQEATIDDQVDFTQRMPVEGDMYQHYLGSMYKVLAVFQDAEDLNIKRVAYQSLTDGHAWCHTVEDFLRMQPDGTPRFKWTGNKEGLGPEKVQEEEEPKFGSEYSYLRREEFDLILANGYRPRKMGEEPDPSDRGWLVGYDSLEIAFHRSPPGWSANDWSYRRGERTGDKVELGDVQVYFYKP